MGLAIRKSAPARAPTAPQKSSVQRPGGPDRAGQLGGAFQPHELLFLQAAAGNAAVAELIDERRTATGEAPAPAATTEAGPALPTTTEAPAAGAAAAAPGTTAEPGPAPATTGEPTAAPATTAGAGPAPSATTAFTPPAEKGVAPGGVVPASGEAVASRNGAAGKVAAGETVKPAGPTGAAAAAHAPEAELPGAAQAPAETGAPPAVAEGAAPAGAAPTEDPAFARMASLAQTAGAATAAHRPAGEKVAEAHSAAVAPANDVASQAAAGQVGKMAVQQPGSFDKKAFMDAVRKAIEAAAPKNLEEADNFKSSGKAGQVKGQVSAMVGQDRQAAEGDIKQATTAPPDPSVATPKPVTPMAAEQPGAPAQDVGAAQAMPRPRPAEESSLAEGPKQVDDTMKDANVTEEQLTQSNEPQFTEALEHKKTAEAHSEEAPKAFQQDEQKVLASSREQASGEAAAGLKGMQGAKANALAGVTAGKVTAKSQDEAKRAEVSGHIESIYNATKADVTGILDGLNGKVDKAFQDGEEKARAAFESFVEVRMNAYKDDRYSGWTGGLKWAKDKLFGMPDKVNEFYTKGRDLYLERMEGVISQVADVVGGELAAAKARIASGQAEITKYVASLPGDLRKVGQEAQDKIQSKFEELQGAVDTKQDEMVNHLAQKYVEARTAVDDRIKDMKDANKGLVDKAKDAVVGVVQTILKLKDMLLGVLAKAASVIGGIIAHPIAFLGNLVKAIGQGLHQFVGNIAEHLRKGLLGWLFGSLAEAGLTLPEKFDLKGVLHLILQILGLTFDHIRGLAVGIVGEGVITRVEQSVEFFKVLATEGPAGLWKWIKDKLAEFKENIMGQIREFIQNAVIMAGIQWLLGLLTPVGAFIKACKAIYDIVMFFVERGSQIISLVNSILDSVGAIAGGALGEAAGYIEQSLAKGIPVAIGFLASLIGLGGLADKIKGIIQRIQEPIHAVITKVLHVVLKPFKFIAGKVKAGVSWAKAKAQQGVAFVKAKAKQGVAWAKKKVQQGVTWVKGKARGLFGGKDVPPEAAEARLERAATELGPKVQALAASGTAGLKLKAQLMFWRLRYRLSALTLDDDGEQVAVTARVNPPRRVGGGYMPKGEPLRQIIEDVSLRVLSHPEVQAGAAAMYEARQAGEPVPVGGGLAGFPALVMHQKEQTGEDLPKPFERRPFTVGEEEHPVTEVRYPGRRAPMDVMVSNVATYTPKSEDAEGIDARLEAVGRQAGMTRSRLAGVMADFVRTGEMNPKIGERSGELSRLTFLIFGRESARSNLAYAPMTIDLVGRGEMTWKEALNRPGAQAGGPDRTTGGAFPMSMRGATRAAEDVESGIPAGLSPRDEKQRKRNVQELKKRQRELAEKWLQSEMEREGLRFFKDRAAAEEFIYRRLLRFYGGREAELEEAV